MKKYMFLFLLLAFLSGCAAAPQETPTPTETPATEVTLTPEPTPTPEPLTAEQAANIYLEFLMDKMPCSYYEETLYHSELYSDMTPEWALKLYHAKDLTGDGIPELYCSGPGVTNIWTLQDRTVTCFGGKTTYEQILANGGIFYHRPGGVPDNDCYFYSWLSPESREYPEISFAAYDMDSDGEMDSFYIDSAEVTRSEWEARTAPYFALRDAEPTEEQKALPFLQWAAELGADISEFLDLEPWQAAYLELLAGYETRRAEYSADAQEFYMERYALYDIDKDGIPELFLIHGLADDGSGTRGTGDAWFSCDLYTAQNGKFVDLKPNPEDNHSFWFGSLYSCPGENTVLYGEGKNFRKVSIIDGKRVDGPNLQLSEDIPYEQITTQLFVPEAEELARHEPTDLQPILDYVPPLEPWQAAYVEIMREELTKLNTPQTREGYYLYDIDKNGIPELLFFYEDFSTPETWHIYTYCPYQNKNAVFLGEFSLSKEEWWTYPEGNGLLKYWVVKGAREVTLYTLENNTLKETQVFPDTVPQPDDLMEVLFPRAETIPGQGLRTDLNEVEDYSLLLAYPAANIYGTRGEAVELSRADFSVYDHVLSPEEQETLESFLPVLTGKEPLTPDWKDGERILLTDWFKELLGDEPGDFPSVFNAFALCDLDGDGAQELILWIDRYGGCYTILHREKGAVNGTYMSVRQFQELQTDGVYASTGGMGNRSYQQAYFENGKLLDKDLGCTRYNGEGELVHYFIGEREVSEAEFEAWLKETMVGDVVWYAAREKKEVTP